MVVCPLVNAAGVAISPCGADFPTLSTLLSREAT
jgi:hypothetical protein